MTEAARRVCASPDEERRMKLSPSQRMQMAALMHRKSQQAKPDPGGLRWPRTRN
jgi:hypothetical protein